MSAETKPSNPNVITPETLAEALTLATRAARSPQDVQFADRFERAMGKGQETIQTRTIRGKSPETGATFEMVVTRSRAFPLGRIVRLEKYTIPAEAYVPRSQGGHLPDGMPIWQDAKNIVAKPGNDTPNAMFNVNFRQYRTDMYWKRDLQSLIGKEPKPHMCVEPKDLHSVQWQESSVTEPAAA